MTICMILNLCDSEFVGIGVLCVREMKICDAFVWIWDEFVWWECVGWSCDIVWWEFVLNVREFVLVWICEMRHLCENLWWIGEVKTWVMKICVILNCMCLCDAFVWICEMELCDELVIWIGVMTICDKFMW